MSSPRTRTVLSLLPLPKRPGSKIAPARLLLLCAVVLSLIATGCPGEPDGEDPGGDDPGGEDPVECVMPEGQAAIDEASLEDSSGVATVTVDEPLSCSRAYTLATTQTLRHGLPDNPRVVIEQAGRPLLRSGSLLLDALYALTLEEVDECSVEAVRDGSFDEGRAVGCGEGGCFETGRLWNYVWTRDTAYAVDLGLAAIDPVRSMNSLDFKLSFRRGGGERQIVQDTGSGGSYPVSSDRVAWALGGWAVYSELQGDAKAAFGARAYEALRNTLEHDRIVVFDPTDGLYRGEQSFLDWREQSYPEWTAAEVVHIAMSKSLSTNLLHLRALEVAAALGGETGDALGAERFAGWPDSLRHSIRRRLWLPEDGLFSTYVTTELDQAPARRFDLLGSALSVILGVADESQAASILERYPHYGPGAPVIWPQQQLVPIYHNRGEWPFVTAYWLRAARIADNDAVADRMVHALVRGAALNLSNMENFEAAGGAPWLEDGEYSGPVVNSQRQLWSVAAFLSMVHQTIFGLEPGPDGLLVSPYVTRGLRNDIFAATDQLVLNDYPFAGRRLTVVIHLPARGGSGGSYRVGDLRLDGEKLADGPLTPNMLSPAGSRLDVELLDLGDRPPAGISVRDPSDWRQVFAPRTPRIVAVEDVAGEVRIALQVHQEEAADINLAIYRDGELIASGLPGELAHYTDQLPDEGARISPCYSLEACFVSGGNCSQRSPPICRWGESAVQEHGAPDFEAEGGQPSHKYDRFHHENWGDPGHRIVLPSFEAAHTGPHFIQLVFGNGAGPIATGITCAVKHLRVEDRQNGEVAGEGLVIMPHLGAWDLWSDSSFVPAELIQGRSYRIVIGDGEGAHNMSVFEHFGAYTAGLGGRDGPFNRVNVAAVKILAR